MREHQDKVTGEGLHLFVFNYSQIIEMNPEKGV